ncbi:MAG: hypothetical protein K2H46_03960 [Muribaculaceae bacterium]|nr:hypothetical protein [Muribaculaceae bacterium]
MTEHYVSMEQAKRLHELGFDGVDKYYVTESFCFNGDPNDYYSEGQLVDAYIVYFINENNEDDYRGVPAPRLDQAAAWLRDKGIHISLNPYSISNDRCDGDNYFWSFELFQVPTGGWLKENGGEFESYEQALSAGIDKVLELLGKEKKK